MLSSKDSKKTRSVKKPNAKKRLSMQQSKKAVSQNKRLKTKIFMSLTRAKPRIKRSQVHSKRLLPKRSRRLRLQILDKKL